MARLKSCYISVVLSLQREAEERADARAAGLSRFIVEYRFICRMLLLCDTLPHITYLSKVFQAADCDYSIISPMVLSTLCSLEQIKVSPGVNLAALDTYLTGITSAGIEPKQLPSQGKEYFQDSIMLPYLNNLIQNLTTRFEDKSIMSAFQIFNPTSLPSDFSDDQKYGNECVKQLSMHFHLNGALAEQQICLAEWSSFRQILKESSQLKKHSEVIHYLCTNPTMVQIYPNICVLWLTSAMLCPFTPQMWKEPFHN